MQRLNKTERHRILSYRLNDLVADLPETLDFGGIFRPAAGGFLDPTNCAEHPSWSPGGLQVPTSAGILILILHLRSTRIIQVRTGSALVRCSAFTCWARLNAMSAFVVAVVIRMLASQ